MRRRILVLPVAAIVIALLSAYRLTRTDPPQPEIAAQRAVEKPAPAFELLDQNKPSEPVRLRRYLDRRQVLVVFFDGRQGADQSLVVRHLREEFELLRKSNIAVLAISTALPQENRKVIERAGPFPFPLLSDPDLNVHRAWGRLDAATGRPLTGVFLVSRAGLVQWSRDSDFPAPLAGAENDITGLTRKLLSRQEGE